MQREITIYGNPILRQKANSVAEITPEIRDIIADMLETMRESSDGIGLAAPQIGLSLRIFVLNIPALEVHDLVVINPEIIEKSEEKKSQEEGCLSFPGINGHIPRHVTIKFTAQDINGESLEYECSEFLARAVQHEIDHLNGVLFIDKMSATRRTVLKKKLHKLEIIGKSQSK